LAALTIGPVRVAGGGVVPDCVPVQVKVAVVRAGRVYVNDWLPQFTLTACAEVPALCAISALEPSALRQATLRTAEPSFDSMRWAPGRTYLVRCPVV
jgi:hypothetical protein